jgi:hypothetical protein
MTQLIPSTKLYLILNWIYIKRAILYFISFSFSFQS